MISEILGKKIGMTPVYVQNILVPVPWLKPDLRCGPGQDAQNDSYNAVQLGFSQEGQEHLRANSATHESAWISPPRAGESA